MEGGSEFGLQPFARGHGQAVAAIVQLVVTMAFDLDPVAPLVHSCELEQLLAAAVGAAFAAPALAPFLDCHAGDEERRGGIGPPESARGVQDEADEQGD